MRVMDVGIGWMDGWLTTETLVIEEVLSTGIQRADEE